MLPGSPRSCGDPCAHASPGRHELGQNFLIDRITITTFVARLARRIEPPNRIVRAGFLAYALPHTPHVLVGNLPFHQTTPMLRRVLHAPAWTHAVLLVQWEVARRRAGVGGATMMTAQWWPWFGFRLDGRVPAAAFRPRLGVDGGLLTMVRRERPLVPSEQRVRYQEFIRKVFTRKGRNLAEILTSAAPGASRRQVREWVRRQRLPATALPKHLSAEQWAELFVLLPETPRSPHRAPPRRDGGR